jgi:hypothetical protein
MVINKDNTIGQLGATDPKLLEELENLKKNELEARNEVIKLQDVIRKLRLLHKFKEVLVADKHQYKIDNLKQ